MRRKLCCIVSIWDVRTRAGVANQNSLTVTEGYYLCYQSYTLIRLPILIKFLSDKIETHMNVVRSNKLSDTKYVHCNWRNFSGISTEQVAFYPSMRHKLIIQKVLTNERLLLASTNALQHVSIIHFTSQTVVILTRKIKTLISVIDLIFHENTHLSGKRFPRFRLHYKANKIGKPLIIIFIIKLRCSGLFFWLRPHKLEQVFTTIQIISWKGGGERASILEHSGNAWTKLPEYESIIFAHNFANHLLITGLGWMNEWTKNVINSNDTK